MPTLIGHTFCTPFSSWAQTYKILRWKEVHRAHIVSFASSIGINYSILRSSWNENILIFTLCERIFSLEKLLLCIFTLCTQYSAKALIAFPPSQWYILHCFFIFSLACWKWEKLKIYAYIFNVYAAFVLQILSSFSYALLAHISRLHIMFLVAASISEALKPLLSHSASFKPKPH